MKIKAGYIRRLLRGLIKREIKRCNWNIKFYSVILDDPDRVEKIMRRQEVLHQLLTRYQRVKR